MLEVKLGNKWTYENYGLYLIANWEISLPEPKLTTVDIPYSNGTIDLSESLTGEPVFNDRDVTFSLLFPKYKPIWNKIYNELINDWHGKRTSILMPDKPHYEFNGRIMIGKLETDNKNATVEVSATVDPYRLKIVPTVITATVPSSGVLTLKLKNERMTTLPEFTISATSQIVSGTDSYSHSAGTFTLANIYLVQGNNQITIKAVAGTTVSISYQEGAL